MSTPSLFGHLASRFAPHPENLATEALLYVLRSPTARAALVRGLGRAGATLPRDLRFSSQVVAEDSSIPDLIGKDEDGQKRLIVEAKFWAGLTENQPGAYIAQLPGELDSVLLFVAPAARFTSLWPELLSRAQGHLAEGDAASLDEHKEFRRVQLDGPRSLVLMSWRLLLSAVRRDLAAAGELTAAADLDQLAGLCERMDTEAFLPLSGEELDGRRGKRVYEFCTIANDAVSVLVERGVASTKGLKTGGSMAEYARFFRAYRHYGCSLCFHAYGWGHLRDTPLWLRIKEIAKGNWTITSELRTKLRPLARETPPRLIEFNGELQMPIGLPVGAERDAVVRQVADQVERVLELLAPEEVAE